jgi:hypothetical protein
VGGVGDLEGAGTSGQEQDRPIVVCERRFVAGPTFDGQMPLGWRLPPKWSATPQARQDRLRRRLPEKVVGVGLCYGYGEDASKAQGVPAAVAGIAVLWGPTGWVYDLVQWWMLDLNPWLRLVVLVGGVAVYLLLLAAMVAALLYGFVRPVADAARGLAAANRLYTHMSHGGGWDWPVSAQRRLEAAEAAEARRDADIRRTRG